MQHNMVTLPKSTRRERMISNVDVAGLQISEQDMRAMDNLDEGFISAWYVCLVRAGGRRLRWCEELTQRRNPTNAA